MSLRSARTRLAYAGDLRRWLAWLAVRDVDVLAAGRVHVDLWVVGQDQAASVRRLSALSSFYRYCAARDLIAGVPTAGGGGDEDDGAAARRVVREFVEAVPIARERWRRSVPALRVLPSR